MTIQIRIEGMDELLAKLDRIGKLTAIRSVMRAAALYLKGKLAQYPEQMHLTRASVYGAPFQSEKQQRYFFWALKAGEIEVPYHRGESARSERLGQSWTIDDQDGGLTQVIGNDTSYGKLVMGSYDQGEQSEFMHQSGWTPYDQIVDAYEDTIIQNVQDAMDREMES